MDLVRLFDLMLHQEPSEDHGQEGDKQVAALSYRSLSCSAGVSDGGGDKAAHGNDFL
jgi:hypothetical protein